VYVCQDLSGLLPLLLLLDKTWQGPGQTAAIQLNALRRMSMYAVAADATAADVATDNSQL